jgi:hypothetical protein
MVKFDHLGCADGYRPGAADQFCKTAKATLLACCYSLVGAAGSADSLKSISAYLDPRSDRVEANRGEVCVACGGSGVITPAATRF